MVHVSIKGDMNQEKVSIYILIWIYGLIFPRNNKGREFDIQPREIHFWKIISSKFKAPLKLSLGFIPEKYIGLCYVLINLMQFFVVYYIPLNIFSKKYQVFLPHINWSVCY